MAAIKSNLKLGGRTLRDASLKPRKERHTPRPISEDEFQRLVGACGSLRDRVMLMVLRDTGGRCGAVCQAKVKDFKGDYLILATDTVKNWI